LCFYEIQMLKAGVVKSEYSSPPTPTLTKYDFDIWGRNRVFFYFLICREKNYGGMHVTDGADPPPPEKNSWIRTYTRADHVNSKTLKWILPAPSPTARPVEVRINLKDLSDMNLQTEVKCRSRCDT
jgi:hypothetical protein